MSDEEVDELLKAVDTSSGEINYTGGLIICSPRSTDLWVLADALLGSCRTRSNDSGQLIVMGEGGRGSFSILRAGSRPFFW